MSLKNSLFSFIYFIAVQKKKAKILKKRPKSARNLLKSDEKPEEKLISKWGRMEQASQITSQQNKKMIQEYQKRDQEDIERRLQVS